jgi:DNA replication and repair protein RecF
MSSENTQQYHTLGVSNLFKRFGRKEVVRGVNFSMHNGEVAGLLGPNGAGKTTILEAIYYLILGRSFRSHLTRRIISHDAKEFVLHGTIQNNLHQISIGTTRSLLHGKQLKVSGKTEVSNLDIIKLLPIQLLNHDSYLLLNGGAVIRRQFIDWGLFHVEQSFLALWKRVETLLKQRNAAIKERARPDYIRIWDEELAISGVELHKLRSEYVKMLIPIVNDILQDLSADFAINISYYPGWDFNKTLMAALAESLKQDLNLGYTTIGPQRADLHIKIGDTPARDHLSRGQQKVAIYALQIAQGVLLHNYSHKSCIYLVDDLLAELDWQKSSLLVELLLKQDFIQTFFTGLELASLNKLFDKAIGSKKIFDVKNDIIF